MVEISILLVDDDAFARTSLSGALTGLGYQVNVFESAKLAYEFAQQNKPKVAILDLDLGPGPSGIDLAFMIRKELPSIGIIFLTSYSDPRFLKSTSTSLPVGSHYLIKSQLNDLSQLANYINYAVSFPLKKGLRAPKSHFKMSDNQIRILQLLASGRTTNQVAAELNVSTKAVEAVIARINSNLGLPIDDKINRRVQLVKAYYKIIGKI